MPFKDDNLDDLFKKAARDYPLKTDNSDWESVASKLNKPFFKRTIAKNKVAKYAMAVLVLAIAMGSMLVYKLNTGSTAVVPAVKEQASVNAAASNTTKPGALQEPTAKTSIAGSTQTSSNNAALFKSAALLTSNSRLLLPVPPALVIAGNRTNYSLNTMVNKPSPSMTAIMMSSKPAPVVANKNDAYEANATDENTIDEFSEPGFWQNDPDENAFDNNTRSEKKLPRSFHQANSFYKLYGTFYAGPEFSMVKFQQINKPGYKIGVSLGYRINNRLSIEVGLQREHLNFYSSGEYLDTTMLKIKSNEPIESVSASSKLTSVPVALRYNFLSRSRGHFFVTAGVNAIIITHSEQYEYTVSKDGVPADLSKYYSSLTPPKYFSGVNASAGYELQLPKFCSMKIESYYQAPVNNLGVGQLPVTSFGLNIGIVKNLK